MQHEYYKEYYYLERKHWWFTAREKIITSFVKKLIKDKHLENKSLRILNIGCGPGRSSEYLSEFGEVVSIEYDKFCCEFASEQTGLEILHGSITNLPFEENFFDLVCAFDVIEHVEDDAAAIKEMERVASANGILLVTVPAFMDLWSHHDVINHHFRRYKLKQLHQLFITNISGKKVFSSYFNFFLFPPIYLFRKLSNVIGSGKNRKGSGSDFEAFNPGIINSLLYKIMRFESKFINHGTSLPFGVSILYCWKKE